MQKYKSNITTTSGAALRNVPVEVIAENGTQAVLFLDREGTVPAANPLRTGADGTFYFYAVNGRYSLQTTVEGATITDRDVVLLMDPEEITVAGPIAEAVAAAEAAAMRAEEAVEDSEIPALVEAVQNAVVDVNTSADIASTKAGEAAASAGAAQTHSDTALGYKNEANASKNAAADSAAAAATSATNAGDSADAAAASAASIAGGPVASSITLPNGTNLNTVLLSGFYRIRAGAVNGPAVSIDDSQLLVIRGLDTITQMVTTYGGNRTFTRSGNPPEVGGAGAWSAWAELARTDSPAFTGAVTGITKSMVGLGNVDNTSDANKPVSTAQATAIALKANLASPALTGNPTTPTQATTDNSTKVVNSSWVRTSMANIATAAGFVLTDTGAELSVRFPTWLGGLVIKSGFTSGTTDANGCVIATFGSAFPAVVRGCVVSNGYPTNYAHPIINSLSLTGVYAQFTTGTAPLPAGVSVQLNYIAIGY